MTSIGINTAILIGVMSGFVSGLIIILGKDMSKDFCNLVELPEKYHIFFTALFCILLLIVFLYTYLTLVVANP
jgi:hypothetical protein